MAEPSRRPAARRRRPDPVELPRTARLTVPRLSDDLAERIRRLIISEDIAEGARLPPERDLAERFGASRPTVSQALRALSLMGLVEIRRGSGAYVVRRPETMVTASVNLMLDLDQRSLSDLMQLRLWLETLGAREAAARTPQLTPAEAAAIGVVGGVCGLFFGLTDQWLYSLVSGDMMNFNVTFRPSPMALVFTVGALAISLLGSLPPARRAARLNIIEAVGVD